MTGRLAAMKEEQTVRDDPYRSFAKVYDEWQRLYPKPFSLALGPRIRDTIKRIGSPTPKLADLACGTGTFAWWWMRTHPSWTVYGTDGSAAMIKAARGIRTGRTPAPRFLVQDLRELALPAPVGVLTCLFDSLNHITREADLLHVFQRAAANLLPSGLFLFDLVEEVSFPEVFTGASILEGPNLYVGIETEFAELRGIGFGQAHFSIFRRRSRGWDRIEFAVRERRWRREETQKLLRRAGLELVEFEQIDPYTSDQFVVPRTFWACQRC
jgi:SAM-dependent methyltransferase